MKTLRIRKVSWTKTPGSQWEIYGTIDRERIRKFFGTKKEAQAWMDDFHERVFTEGKDAALMPPEIRIAAAKAAKILAPFGASLIDAANFFAARHRSTAQKPVGEVVEELLGKKTRDAKSQRTLDDLKSRLGRFSEDFQMDIADVTGPSVQKWLDGLGLSAQSVKNYRRVIGTLFRFAVARGYIPKGTNPVEDTEAVKVQNGEAPVIYTPEELATLLSVAPEAFKPCLALGAFAGLRSAEIERQRWDDIDLAEGRLVVTAGKVRTKGRRRVPISENLKAWLAPHAKKSGPVWEGAHENFSNTQRRVGKRVEWKKNALRRSFISYRLEIVKSEDKVAIEAGNSGAMIDRHYREIVSEADAEKWFNIRPEAPGNLVKLEKAS